MAVGNEHKKNIRPYILIFCFFWGLVLGFASYMYMKTAAQRLEIIEVAEEKENQRKQKEYEKSKVEIEQIDPFKKTEDVERPPEVTNVLAKPEVKLIDEKIIAPDFRQPPIIPILELEGMPGLTGLTVIKPVKPVPPKREVVNRPVQTKTTPARTRRKRNPFADESVLLDDVAPPELDD